MTTPSTVDAVISLAIGAACIPIGVLLVALCALGRELTRPGERTALGTLLGWFCLLLGVFFVALALSTIARWYDLDGTRASQPLSVICKCVAIFSLLAAMVVSVLAAPHMLDRIERGVWIDFRVDEEGRS